MPHQKKWWRQCTSNGKSKETEKAQTRKLLADVNENKMNQYPHQKKDGRNGNNGGRNQNNRRNGKPKGKRFWGVCNHCGKSGHEEKDCWKKHPELIPAKFAKSGAAISDKKLVTSVLGLNVPANTKHVFGSENENSSRTKNKYHGFGKFYG